MGGVGGDRKVDKKIIEKLEDWIEAHPGERADFYREIRNEMQNLEFEVLNALEGRLDG